MVNLEELLSIQAALINLKMYVSQERNMDPEKVKKIVYEAYDTVMKKIDSWQRPFYL